MVYRSRHIDLRKFQSGPRSILVKCCKVIWVDARKALGRWVCLKINVFNLLQPCVYNPVPIFRYHSKIYKKSSQYGIVVLLTCILYA